MRTFHVRIRNEDNEENSTVYSAQFSQKGGVFEIRVQNLIKKGKYEELLLGKSIAGLQEWLSDSFEKNWIFDDENDTWRREISREALLVIVEG